MPASNRIAALLALLLAACGGGGGSSSNTPNPNPTSGTLQIAGTVMEDGGSGGTSPLSGAEVRISVDRNGNGTVDAGELATATTGADGRYTLSFAVSAGEPAVVRFSKSGWATAVRTLQAAPSAAVPVSATLRPLDTLTVRSGALTNQTGSVSLAGLPAGASGSARVFNPVTETDAFPGDFSDSAGNRLVSGVFGAFELKDGSGNPLETLGAPATMKMRMPRDTWPVIVDVTGGNQQIDVPLYFFREATGEWVRDGSGWLEDSSGARIPPSALPSLLDGSYVGAVFAVGQVTHFSAWNVDWPVSTHGCIRGRVVNAAGNAPVPGATVAISGVSYTGTSRPVTVGTDGTFCIEVMRSEAAGEDVDGDGVTGETSSVKIRVVAGDQVYDFGDRSPGTANATCAGTGCMDAGDLALTDARKISAARCTFSGTAYRRDGTTPAAGAMLVAWDDSVPAALQSTLCTSGQANLCTIVAAAAADGSFSFTTPSMGSLFLFGLLSTEIVAGATELSVGQRLLGDCPTAPVSFRLDEGFISVVATLSLDAGVISWTPAGYGAIAVSVSVSEGVGEKWLISVPEGQVIASPVTYGTVPAGATQTFPVAGAPAALANGDRIQVLIAGQAADGTPYYGGGQFVVGSGPQVPSAMAGASPATSCGAP